MERCPNNISPCGPNHSPRPVKLGEINYTVEQINDLLAQIPDKANRSEVPEKVTSYNSLKDKPTINNKKIEGNKSAKDYGLVSEDRMLDVTDKLASEVYQAKKTAQSAAKAVSTLQGLANADTSSIVAAGVVAQVETNTSEIIGIKASTVYLSQKAYKDLIESGTYDPNVEYNVLEEDEE